MTPKQNMDDIIFEHRNKHYGAYLLRSDYSDTLLKSLFLTMALALGIALICFLYSKKSFQNHDTAILLPPQQYPVITTPVDFRPKSPEHKTETVTPNSKNKPLQAALVIRDTLAFKLDTSTTLLPNASPKHDKEGFLEANHSEKNGSGKTDLTGKETKSDTVVASIADEYPEFEGGLAALNRWIASRLRYPADAIDHTKQGKVHVKFIVDEQGQVRFPTALNKLGYGLEEEALRVVAGIPKFKSPAKIKGQPVKCYFVLPINFKLY